MMFLKSKILNPLFYSTCINLKKIKLKLKLQLNPEKNQNLPCMVLKKEELHVNWMMKINGFGIFVQIYKQD